MVQMADHINTTWRRIPSDQAKLRAANLIKIIARVEKRLRQQRKNWSVNGQDKKADETDEKEHDFVR